MYFILGFDREAPVEIEKTGPSLCLLAVGIVVALLVIFLSFENAYGATLPSPPSLGTPCGSMEASAGDGGCKMNLEQSSWRSELENSPPVGWIS